VTVGVDEIADTAVAHSVADGNTGEGSPVP
jgi:hypothetical protein